MQTAIDTNVLSALWSAEPFATVVAGKLGAAKSEGGLVISGVVFAELLAHPKATMAQLQSFLADTGILVDFEFQRGIWEQAGHRFARYVQRRRRGNDSGPHRLLADFIIGSHALLAADRLMTLDPKRYRQDFAELDLV